MFMLIKHTLSCGLVKIRSKSRAFLILLDTHIVNIQYESAFLQLNM